MQLNDYQELSKATAKEWANPDTTGEMDHKTTALFLATALNGETGELAEKLKKYVREDDPSYLEGAEAEIGDCLWYLAQIASLLDVDFDDVAEDNLEKLLDREERDQILGEGDER